jgi:hypothetical protein
VGKIFPFSLMPFLRDTVLAKFHIPWPPLGMPGEELTKPKIVDALHERGGYAVAARYLQPAPIRDSSASTKKASEAETKKRTAPPVA